MSCVFKVSFCWETSHILLNWKFHSWGCKDDAYMHIGGLPTTRPTRHMRKVSQPNFIKLPNILFKMGSCCKLCQLVYFILSGIFQTFWYCSYPCQCCDNSKNNDERGDDHERHKRNHRVRRYKTPSWQCP